MTAEIVNIRDYKRREEHHRALVRMAKEVLDHIDTAPSEMPPYKAPENDPA